MSNRAVEAYQDGEKPKSKWTKKNIINQLLKHHQQKPFHFDFELIYQMPIVLLRELALKESSWHHTSKFYNQTSFYRVDPDEMYEFDQEGLVSWIHDYAEDKRIDEQEEKWECSFIEWTGKGNYKKPTVYTEIGTIKGNWFYRKDGSKKSITANGFQMIKKIKNGE